MSDLVRKYSFTGTMELSLGVEAADPSNPGTGEFGYAFGIAVDDYIYVTDAGNSYVSRFALNGSYVGRFQINGGGQCRGIALPPEKILVVDGTNDTVEISSRIGVFQSSFGGTGTANGQFIDPIGVAYYNNKIYVADTGNNRIQVFNSTGTYESQFGSSGTGPGEFNEPTGVTVVSSGIYVLDRGNNRIQRFELDGTYIEQAGNQGSGNGQLSDPFFIAADSDYIYVADTNNERIEIFDHNITIATCVNDVLPQAISGDILCNDLYGLGLSSEVWNAEAATRSAQYCEINDLYISMLFDSQVSVLDALQAVINHHEGFITYINGLISHEQLKVETPLLTLTHDDLVKKIKTLPVSATSKAGKDYKNRINIEYTKRANDYVAGTVTADDIIDIDKYGVLDASINLDGLCTWSRAIRMAYRQLRKQLIPAQSYTFVLGLKNLDLRPGQVVAFTDSTMEADAVPIRIGAVTEQKDYQIGVQAMEDNFYINTFVYDPGITTTSSTSLEIGTGEKVLTVPADLTFIAGGSIHISEATNSSNYMDGSVTSYSGTTLTVQINTTGGSGTFNNWNINYLPATQPSPVAYDSPAGSVVHAILFSIPSIYSTADYLGISYSRSENEAWAGAILYKAYAEGGPYNFVTSRAASGITGIVQDVVADTSIDVLLDTDATLSSAADFAELTATPMMNLFLVRTASGDKFCRFMTAELLSARLWRLTDFIYDEAGTPTNHSTGDIAADDMVAVYSGGLLKYDILPVDSGKTLYFKVASYNRANTSEDLATVTALSIDLSQQFIVVQEVNHSLSNDSITLTSKNTLSIQDSFHAVSNDGITLS